MGLITRTEAMKILGVQRRVLFKYMKRGYLRKVNHNSRLYLDRDDVLAFKEAQENPLSKPDAVILAKVCAQVREQQGEIDVIKRLLDLYNEPLNLEDFSINALYSAAIALDISTWDEGWENEWAELLVRFREEDLFQLERITGDEHPWKPFYKLIMVIQELLKAKNNKELNSLLDAAREHFRKLILIWIEIKNSPRMLDTLPRSEFGRFVMARLREKHSKVEKKR